MDTSRIPSSVEMAPAANRSLPMLLLRLRETVLLPLRPVIRRFDMSEQQARVLLVLDEAGPLEMAALAEACCVHPPSLSRVVSKLLARGWLDRERPYSDQRRHVTALSSSGRDVAKDLRLALRQAHDGTRQQVGAIRMGAITAELEAAIDALGNPSLTDECSEQD